MVLQEKIDIFISYCPGMYSKYKAMMISAFGYFSEKYLKNYIFSNEGLDLILPFFTGPWIYSWFCIWKLRFLMLHSYKNDQWKLHLLFQDKIGQSSYCACSSCKCCMIKLHVTLTLCQDFFNDNSLWAWRLADMFLHLMVRVCVSSKIQ